MKMSNVIRTVMVIAVVAAWAGLLALPVMGDSPSDPPLIGNAGPVGEDIASQPATNFPSDPPLIDESAPAGLPATGDSGGGIYVPPNLPAPGETELTIGELAAAQAASSAYTMDDQALLAMTPAEPGALPATGGPDLSALNETEPGDLYWSSNEARETPGALPATGAPTGGSFGPAGISVIEITDLGYPALGSKAPSVLPVTGAPTGGSFGPAGISVFEITDLGYPAPASNAPGGLPVTGASTSGSTNPSALTDRERASQTLPMTGSGLGVRINPSELTDRERAPQILPETGMADQSELHFSVPFQSDQLVRQWLESVGNNR